MASSVPIEEYDMVIIGSGEAAKYLAWTFGAAGKRIAIIENKWIGGSCPNIACLPSKNFIHSATVVHQAKKAAQSGFFPFDVSSVSMPSALQRKRDMVKGLVDMHLVKFQETGVELINGFGRFKSADTIAIELADGGARHLQAKTIVICTGASVQLQPLPGLEQAKPLTHIEMLEIDEIPDHLIIIGGGYIGLEFAQAFVRLGSKVTVIERNDTILKNEDEDVSSALAEILSGDGVDFKKSTVVNKVSGLSGRAVTINVTQDGQTYDIEGSHILCATGRKPNTSGIGLEVVGITTTSAGFIKVNPYLQTGVPGVFAVGDCAGSPQHTHIAFDDFRIVHDVLTGGGSNRSTTSRQIPSTLFTSPELAHVGLREKEAKAQSIPYRLAKIPMMAFLRTRTMDETAGFAKALISQSDDTILGFTALGANAGELLPVVQLAMSEKLSYKKLSGLIVTHPTMAEGLVTLFGAVPAR